jgi:hypothetical protein
MSLNIGKNLVKRWYKLYRCFQKICWICRISSFVQGDGAPLHCRKLFFKCVLNPSGSKSWSKLFTQVSRAWKCASWTPFQRCIWGSQWKWLNKVEHMRQVVSWKVYTFHIQENSICLAIQCSHYVIKLNYQIITNCRNCVAATHKFWLIISIQISLTAPLNFSLLLPSSSSYSSYYSASY